MDETWCLFDRQVIDDEIYRLLGRFAAGVRVVAVSDSCHSGTVTRMRREAGTGSPEKLARDTAKLWGTTRSATMLGLVQPRSKSRCRPLPEVLVAVHTSRLACRKVGKARVFTPVRDSSGESRLSIKLAAGGARIADKGL